MKAYLGDACETISLMSAKMSADKKAYGLSGPAGLSIKGGKKGFGLQKPTRPAASSVFGNAVDEEEVDGHDRAKTELRRMMSGQEGRSAVLAAKHEALAVDASIYDYDGVYDNIQADRHGQSTGGFPKKSYDFDFNKGDRFRYRWRCPGVGARLVARVDRS